MKKPRWQMILVIALLICLCACQDPVSQPVTDPPVTTAPPVTDPPVTDPQTTTAPPVTDPPTTTAPPETEPVRERYTGQTGLYFYVCAPLIGDHMQLPNVSVVKNYENYLAYYAYKDDGFTLQDALLPDGSIDDSKRDKLRYDDYVNTETECEYFYTHPSYRNAFTANSVSLGGEGANVNPEEMFQDHVLVLFATSCDMMEIMLENKAIRPNWHETLMFDFYEIDEENKTIWFRIYPDPYDSKCLILPLWIPREHIEGIEEFKITGVHEGYPWTYPKH